MNYEMDMLQKHCLEHLKTIKVPGINKKYIQNSIDIGSSYFYIAVHDSVFTWDKGYLNYIYGLPSIQDDVSCLKRHCDAIHVGSTDASYRIVDEEKNSSLAGYKLGEKEPNAIESFGEHTAAGTADGILFIIDRRCKQAIRTDNIIYEEGIETVTYNGLNSYCVGTAKGLYLEDFRSHKRKQQIERHEGWSNSAQFNPVRPHLLNYLSNTNIGTLFEYNLRKSSSVPVARSQISIGNIHASKDGRAIVLTQRGTGGVLVINPWSYKTESFFPCAHENSLFTHLSDNADMMVSGSINQELKFFWMHENLSLSSAEEIWDDQPISIR